MPAAREFRGGGYWCGAQGDLGSRSGGARSRIDAGRNVGRSRCPQRAFQAWKVVQDHVSVNLSEADAPEVIRLMLKRGIGVEAGLATVADAERYVALPEAASCLRILIEIEEQESAAALRVAHGIIAVLDRAGSKLPRQLHGFDASKWVMHAEALRLGLDQRIGFEDGGFLPDGRGAKQCGVDFGGGETGCYLINPYECYALRFKSCVGSTDWAIWVALSPNRVSSPGTACAGAAG